MRRALGKGLAQLLGEQRQDDASALQEVSIAAISPNPRQPRSEFKEEPLRELAASIREIGVLQPIIVRPAGEDKYEIIAGERRWRAAALAGLDTVPVIVRHSGEQESLALALIENIQREDISPLECARAYQQLIAEHGLTQDELAKQVGKSRSAVANVLRLLKLPEEVMAALAEEKITEGHARALLQFATEAEQLIAFRRIIERSLTVREVERLASKGVPGNSVRSTETAREHRDATAAALSEFFGSPVRVLRSSRGESGGKIEIEFFDDDDLGRILERLGIRL